MRDYQKEFDARVAFIRKLVADAHVRGIVFGKPAAEDKFESYKVELRRVVGLEAGRPDLPILYNVNVGHSYPIGLFPLGLRYGIDCEEKRLRLLEPATR